MRAQLEDLKQSDLKLHGIYRGVVESNADTEQRGRCQIRVYGIHSPVNTASSTEGIPTADLPWAEPVLGLIEGSISGYGLFSVPLQGSHVFVFFENGNHMQPRYFGSAPGVVSVLPTGLAFEDPSSTYPDIAGNEFPAETRTAPTVYPHNIVFATHGGHLIEIDSTTGEERLNVVHPVGTSVLMDKDGNLTIIAPGDGTITIDGDCSITVTGDCTITANIIRLN
jgi:hypothetical protein